MNWILLIIIVYFFFAGIKSLFILSDEDKKLYGEGGFYAVKSKEEIEMGCSSNKMEEHNKNRSIILTDENGLKYLKKI